MKKNSTLDAINRFSQRKLDELQPKVSTRRNKKPEKEVEKACLAWMRARGWSVEIYEAKATYNPRLGFYKNQAMKAGTLDCLGSNEEGHSVAIEFKAPGKLSTFNSPARIKQKEFCLGKIAAGWFSCVADSVERLEQIYTKWYALKLVNRDLARKFLVEMLPAERESENDNLIFD